MKIEAIDDLVLRDKIEHVTLAWETGDLLAIACNKRSFLQTCQLLEEFPMTPKFETYRGMFQRWSSVFCEASEARMAHDRRLRRGQTQEPLDERVLDDVVCLNNFAQVLQLPGLRPLMRPGFFDTPCVHQ